MKYCRSCKTRAADSDAVCPKCGQSLAVMGIVSGPANEGAGGAPQLTLQGQIRELEAVRQRNVSRSRALAIIAGCILLGIVLVLYNVYSYTVLSYAVLENVEVLQDDSADQLVHIAFDVVKPGKVAYDRRSGGERTEKVDQFAATGRQQLAWAWPSKKETGIDFSVVYRGGWTRTAVEKHFNVSGKQATGKVDIVFLLDTTGSMENVIRGLQQKCIEFASVVRDKGFDCRLGLIGFGDVDAGEPMSVFEPTGEPQRFQHAVAEVPRTRGGDDPESSLEAIRRALQLDVRNQATVCFVLITDESCHHEEEIPSIAEALKTRKIVSYVVSRKNLEPLYSPLCVNGGRMFAIDEAKFDDILLNVAKAITNQIRYE